jgi:arylformamidase
MMLRNGYRKNVFEHTQKTSARGSFVFLFKQFLYINRINKTNAGMSTKVIDLTHLINENITVFPGTPAPKITQLSTIENNGYAELMLTMCTHTGTHIDAPSHMVKGAKSLDQLPPHKFTGRAIAIPCHNRESIDLHYLKTFERRIPEVRFILFHTGWQEKWKTKAYFEGYPTLTEDAASWLTSFNLHGIGFDTISADKVSAIDEPNHHILFKKEMLIIENLTNMDKLPDSIFNLVCLPLNIEHADGSPVRAMAMVE